MIVRIFRSGVSNGESPVNYLLGDKDHTGEIRSVKAELLEGDPQTTIDIINSIHRKHKYISGCLAFRDAEKPSKAEIRAIIDDFKKTFCPALTGDNFNSLFVLHQEKGNTEVHFVIPTQELSTGRRMNIHPPGPRNIAFFSTFTTVTNHKMHYAQVVEDPLKLAFTDFERKTPDGRKDRSNKNFLHQKIIKAVGSGKIHNRNELCQFLDDKLGLTITRQGKDYISVVFPGSTKARRLRGALYTEGADYQSLVQASIDSRKPKHLSPVEFRTEQTKLNGFIQERAQFNTKAYLTPRPIRRLARQMNSHVIKSAPPRTITTRSNTMKTDYLPIIKNIILNALRVAREERMSKAQAIKPLPNLQQSKLMVGKIRNKSQEKTSTPAPQGSAQYDLKLAIAEIETSLYATAGELSFTNDPVEIAKIQQRMAKIRMQLEKLHADLRMAKIREGLNHSNPKPS